ncbi:LPS assembly protein LptD [Brevundimonas sp. 2R-24]|uniref:LPS-assembly protein LptD n=1 Tax=Peiella sedimenti TaxID=3061083 RepID=A0ABT8SKK5_9CAUL|nr:LPS assembly protein LptD [Caulobacteraceae bacterium XZ-24]
MISRRPLDRSGARPNARLSLIAGAAAAAVLTGLTGQARADEPPASCQTRCVDIPVPAQTAAPPELAPGEKGPDGLAPGELYIEGDAVTGVQDSDEVQADGSVQARYEGRTLRADHLTYNRQSGLVTARGNAQIINPDGTVQYADTVTLDDDLLAGVATGFATRLEDGVKLAAATAVRRSETVNELNRAVFTPCLICTEDGEPREPTWSIQADRVIQDQGARTVYYRDAVIRVAGVPVFYSPVFWHPDPTAERASGLLVPEVSISDRRGVSYEQPYLWVISPYQDLIISPQINTEVNPLLNLDWRKRFWSGEVRGRGGVTYEQDFGDVALRDGSGNVLTNPVTGDILYDRNVQYGEERTRSYILADGVFNIDENWRWGFSAERTNDKFMFDRYSISDVYTDRGLYLTDYRRLISQIYAERQTPTSYFSIAAMAFQSLRAVGDFTQPTLIGFQDDGVLPIVAPLVESRFDLGRIAGGRLRLRGSAVALTRTDYVGAPVLNPAYAVPGAPDGAAGLPGVDTRRASAVLDWRRVMITEGGLRFEPFAEARGDAYSISELAAGAPDESIFRASATLGVDLRYPLIRRFGWGHMLLEPMAQIAISPDADIDPRIPNEDSQAVELDETTLFETSKFPGYDLYEGGLRVSLGGRLSAEWGQGRRASLFVGRMYRANEEVGYRRPTAGNPAVTYDPTGISETESDWVVAATFTPFARVNGFSRARLDGDTFDIRRAETGVTAFYQRNFVSIRHVIERTDPDPVAGGLTDFQYVQASGQLFIRGPWGLTANVTRDLDENLWRRSEVGFLYEDDCIRVEVVYERNENSILARDRASEGVFLRLTLATFGVSGYERTSSR